MRRRGSRCTGRAFRRLCAAGAGLAATLTVLPAATGVLPAGRTAAARADDQTVSQDGLRTGWDPNESGLSPSAVGSSTFGPLPHFPVKLNGQVYGQPLVVGSEVIVATENDYVYGINGATGSVNWSKKVGTPYHITTCVNIVPHIGVTGSPVYDPGTGKVYLIAQVMSGKKPVYRLIGISPGTGAFSTVATISGKASNGSGISFSPKQELQRPGLLLLNGSVYAAFGSHCDHKPYVGFVAGVNLSTHASRLWTDETKLTSDQAGIWQSGGGLVSDGSSIYFTSGNGVSPAPAAGSRPPGQLAESLVRLAVNPNGSLAAKDFFSPANAPSLDAADTDWGSGGPIGLPFGTSAYPGLIVQAGKDGRVFVLDRSHLGGRKQGSRGGDAYLAKAGPYGGQWGHPAAFAGTASLAPGTSAANDYVYYIGRNDKLRVLRFGANSAGKPTVADVANSTAKFGYTSGSPVVTSNGTSPGSAVVWAVNSSGANGTGTLRAYAGAPAASCTASVPCTLHLIKSWPTGKAASFATPATSNNSVYVGTLNGYLYGFGVLPPAAAVLTAPAATFRPTGVGSAATRQVTVTATTNVTVTGVSSATTSSDTSSAAQFGVDASKVTETAPGGHPHQVTFPVGLHKGDKLTAPVTFTPAGPGGTTGTLSFTTTSASRPSVEVPLAGDGTAPGLYASASPVQFALVGDLGQFESWIPVGISVPREITFTNGGATPETITGATLPPPPFSVTGVPPAGTVLQPGQSFVAQVTFAPVTPDVSYSDSLTVTTSDGPPATVRLVSQSLSPSSLFQASPSSVNLGRVPVGKKATFTITVTNTGNEPATMDGSSTLNAPFHAAYPVTPQLPVNAGYDLKLPVTFTPSKRGTFTVSYRITWTDVLGTHTLTIPVTGTGV